MGGKAKALPHTRIDMNRALLIAVVAVIAVMVVSWTLGELLRQRKKK
jgi:hypothetical protein